MTGHLACPDFAEELGASLADRNLPATLSQTLTTTLLRERLGFTGVIVTDAMEMHAITKLFGDGEAAVRALEAGADVLLMPVEPEGAFLALQEATDDSRISVESLREKVGRIWNMRKIRAGAGTTTTLSELETKHMPLSQTIARSAIRLTGKIDLQHAALLIITDDRPQAAQKAEHFASAASDLFQSVRTVTVSQWQTSPPIIDANTIIATFHRARGYLGGAATDWTLPRIMASVAAEGGAVPRGLILIGSPYLDQDFTTAPQFVLKTFSESTPSIDAAIERLKDI
jgi:beta-glucosidase-like glycosyl hydrolase